MTPNRRILLNIVATYGRSLYAQVIGLFCGRWTLMTLGEVDVSVRYWVTRILVPLALLIAASTAAGLVPMAFLPPSFWRVVATTACVEAALLPLTWFFMFDDSERSFVMSKLLGRLPVVGEKFRPR